MGAPGEIINLIERFDRNRDTYMSGRYNETQLRIEFVDPFFEALGWDVSNRAGYSEPYKDVIHEDAIKIGGVVKAPDYCFRIGGSRKFFVEAKKPSVKIKDEPNPAFQLRRYAWSAKLPLSVLTDFEEFAVYDCRIKPAQTDKPSTARTIYLEYTKYPDRWDEIHSIFSKEALLRGSFDRYVESSKLKRGTTEVDAAFLAEIEKWRDSLARNIALRNPKLSQRELNFAVQRVIDRIIFLRICEDRGIEHLDRLRALMNGANVYRRLVELFRDADDKYNSGLFHFRAEKDRAEEPDRVTLDIAIDDKALREIIGSLYYPESPYEFSVLPADILGQVYEQFLGKIIRLTPSHQAKIEYKPEVKKAGGVYYTPTYIVDYIVKNTVGNILGTAAVPAAVGGASRPDERGQDARRNTTGETPAPQPAARDAESASLRRPKAVSKGADGISPKAVSKFKILDPACGSGSFLIGAYQYLLDWHRDYYLEDGPEKHTKEIYQGAGGAWRLTTAEKKRILLNNIFGVDIDPQAVEVTKLSLLLKVLEGETEETIKKTLQLFHQRALPDLGKNIKCGNSLIGPDFYKNRQMTLLDDDEKYRINVFDWDAEFLDIMKSGGFDAVIGNPPYGAIFSKLEIDYIWQKFDSISKLSIDSFALFIEKSSNLLTSGGFFGMILQSAWVSSPAFSKLRDLFISRFCPLAFAAMPYDVFGAYVDTTIVIAKRLKKKESLSNLNKALVKLSVFPPRYKIHSLNDYEVYLKEANAVEWFKDGHNELMITLSEEENNIIKKINKIKTKFSDITDIQRGVTPFHISKEKPETNAFIAFTGTVRRYITKESKPAYIRYDKTLAEYKPPKYFKGPRILLRELISRQFRLQATYVDENFITNKSMQSLLLHESQYSIFYLLGLLNSKLLSWYFLSIHSVGRRDDFPKIVLKQTRDLPIRKITFSDPTDKSRHDRMVELVEGMLDMNVRLGAAKAEQERVALGRQIAATDAQIDALVYDLYGLTESEIRIVEGEGK